MAMSFDKSRDGRLSISSILSSFCSGFETDSTTLLFNDVVVIVELGSHMRLG